MVWLGVLWISGKLGFEGLWFLYGKQSTRYDDWGKEVLFLDIRLTHYVLLCQLITLLPFRTQIQAVRSSIAHRNDPHPGPE